MSLHNRTKTPTPERPEFTLGERQYDETQGECVECGSRDWSQVVYGRYRQRAFYSFGNGANYADYDGMESTDGTDDSDPWECVNGHYPTQQIEDMLSEVG